ncbi:MAG: aryl-sulfate sulfotransferase, partial [Chloroflexi bacterium]|nr:aryl-sulfate sulfotransferase [Chloroflexota bacterium]
MVWTREHPTGLVYRDAELSAGGYTLFSSTHGEHATLLDEAGRVVHHWRHDGGIQYARLLAGGHLLMRTRPPTDAGGLERIGGSSAALIELDWDGNVVWEHHDPTMHHDFQRLANGNLLLLLWRKLPEAVNERVGGGHHHEEDPDVMWGDVVQEITPAGETVREWRSWEHLSLDDDLLCPLESRREWTHANAISVTPDGQWLISFRLIDTVALIDPASGAFTWKWGADTLSHQHAASWLDSGNVLIFDNGCHRRRGPSFSQVIEVDPASGETVWTYRSEVLLGFYSFMTSGAERLANGNTLITEGADGHVFEV